MLFASDRVGWLLAGLNTILKTTDAGRTWTVLNTGLVRPGTDVSGLWFADEHRGWAAGAIDQQPTIWETGDGGESWSVEQSWPRAYGDANGAMLDIRFADATHGWAVGFNGGDAIIVASSDAGRHWKTQYTGAEITGQFQEVRCEDATNCWVLGPSGVMRTEDGGEYWRLIYFDNGLLFDIDVVGHSNVWVAGVWGHLLHATRRGTMWHRVPFTGMGTSFFVGVRFVSGDLGWACTTNGEILMTRDGGKTWIREASPIDHHWLGPEIVVGAMASTSSTLFAIANPGHLLARPIK